MVRPADPGSDFYEGVGRVVVLSTQLLGYAGAMVHAAQGGSTVDDSWIDSSGRVGLAPAGMRNLVADRSDDFVLIGWWKQTELVLAERHSLAHSLLVLEQTGPSRDPDYRWYLKQTADRRERELPTKRELDSLILRMTGLCSDGLGILDRLRLEYQAR